MGFYSICVKQRGFYLFSSPEPKAQVNFSDQNMSVVRRRCRCRRCFKLFTFSFSSPESLDQFQPKFGTKHPLVKGIQVSSNEEPINSKS